MGPIKTLKPIAPHMVMPDGTTMPFEEQVAMYAYGEMGSGDMFVVADGTAPSEYPARAICR